METGSGQTAFQARPRGWAGRLRDHLRRRWLVYLGLLVSAFFVYHTLQGIWERMDEVWSYLVRAQYLWIVPGVAVYFCAVWARTWRWHYMLRPIQKIPLKQLFPILCIGYMGNNIYPYRAGEVLRAYVLWREKRVNISATLAAVVAERIFDGIVMLLFVFIGLPFLPSIPPEWRRWVVMFTLLFFGALGVFFLIALSPRRTEAVYGWLIDRLLPPRFRGPVKGVADRFVDGLRCLRSPRDVAMILVTSIVIWLAETVKYWFVMHSFTFPSEPTGFPVPFYVLMLMNGVVNLFTTLPAAPGYIGTFDDPGIRVLAAFGVDTPVAAAYTFALHAALWLPITLVGAFFMLHMGISWGRVRQEMAQDKGGVAGQVKEATCPVAEEKSP